MIRTFFLLVLFAGMLLMSLGSNPIDGMLGSLPHAGKVTIDAADIAARVSRAATGLLSAQQAGPSESSPSASGGEAAKPDAHKAELKLAARSPEESGFSPPAVPLADVVSEELPEVTAAPPSPEATSVPLSVMPQGQAGRPTPDIRVIESRYREALRVLAKPE